MWAMCGEEQLQKVQSRHVPVSWSVQPHMSQRLWAWSPAHELHAPRWEMPRHCLTFSSSLLSMFYGFWLRSVSLSTLRSWRMDELGSVCTETEHDGPQEGRGNTHTTNSAFPKRLRGSLPSRFREQEVCNKKESEKQVGMNRGRPVHDMYILKTYKSCTAHLHL